MIAKEFRKPLSMFNFKCKKWYIRPANPQGKSVTQIPTGFYCTGCPYWRLNSLKEPQMNGYCQLLNVGDWMPGQVFGLLWDQLKLCHIREYPDYASSHRPLRFVQQRRFDSRWGKPRVIINCDASVAAKMGAPARVEAAHKG